MGETADILVIDGESGGSTPWEFDSITEDGSCVFQQSSGAAIHGSGGYEAVPTNNNTDNDMYGTKSFSSQSDMYLRYYFKVSSDWVCSDDEGFYVRPLYENIYYTILLLFKYDLANTAFGVNVYFRDTSGAVLLTERLEENVIYRGTSYCFEFRYVSHASTGGASFWLDQVLQDSDYTKDTSTFTPNILTPGIQGFYGSPTITAGKLYFDDIVLSTTGPIGAYSGPTGGGGSIIQNTRRTMHARARGRHK